MPDMQSQCWICPECYDDKHHTTGDAHCLKQQEENRKQTEPDWTSECENCGDTPVVPATGLCGPCTFGEADTIGGNW